MAETVGVSTSSTGGVIRSLIPARIDRLSWAPFHTRMVIALGTAWVLDGLEITIASAVGAVLNKQETLGLSSTQVGAIATVYLLGEVFGALLFGRLSDALGRKNLFVVTLGVYLAGNALTALTWGNDVAGLAFLYLSRFIAGAGIGGEYAAINSAIDEMMPAKYRGRVDIAVNGTYWGGAILGTLGTFVLLHHMPLNIGWRLGFLLDPILGALIWNLRRHLPESPRWLIMHGREPEAEENIAIIEREVQSSGQKLAPVDESQAIAGTYLISGALLAITAVMFNAGMLNAITQTLAWCIIFFASAGASSAYLTVSEIFPLEIRAQAIAVFFAIAQCFGAIGPVFYGHLIGQGDPGKLFIGYLIGAGVMVVGGVVEIFLGVDAEGKSL